MSDDTLTRRPIKARDTQWAAGIARWLGRRGVRPNQISVASVFFAAGACAALVGTTAVSRVSPTFLFLGAAGCIQLRLLCNLFDGMVAVEGGFKTKSGEIYNELPDRFADAFILVGAGYAHGHDELSIMAGWAAAVAAVTTAYVRALGAAAGASQQFIGPMAKQHRMAIMTIACLLAAVGTWQKWPVNFLAWALWVVVTGCVITIGRRCVRIVRELESK